MREVIILMHLMNEIDKVYKLSCSDPKVFCKVFKDNESCKAMTTTRKFSLCTKHVVIKCHHFRKFVDQGVVQITSINTKEQTADIFTKPLDDGLLFAL